MQRVGLRPEYLNRYPHEFSGGQRQRIGIARCMIMNPEFVIADEPISALDVSIRAQVLNLIREFQQERKMTVLFIAHDLSVVRYISDRIAVIYAGHIVEIAEANRLFEAPLHCLIVLTCNYHDGCNWCFWYRFMGPSLYGRRI